MCAKLEEQGLRGRELLQKKSDLVDVLDLTLELMGYPGALRARRDMRAMRFTPKRCLFATTSVMHLLRERWSHEMFDFTAQQKYYCLRLYDNLAADLSTTEGLDGDAACSKLVRAVPFLGFFEVLCRFVACYFINTGLLTD